MSAQQQDLENLPQSEAAAALPDGVTDPPLAGEARRKGRVEPPRRLIAGSLLLCALLVAALVSAHDDLSHRLLWLACLGGLVVAFDRLLGDSRSMIRIDPLTIARDTILATSAAALTTLSVRVLVGSGTSSADDVVVVWLCTTSTLVVGRVVLARLEIRDRRARIAAKPTLIVGAGHVGQLTARRLLERPELGLLPVGFLDKNPLDLNGQATGLSVLGASWDLEGVVSRFGVEHAIFTFSTAPHDVLLRMVQRCQQLGISVSVIPRLFERVPSKISVDHIGGLAMLSIHPVDPRCFRYRLKYAVDRCAAALLLLLLSPLLLISALAVRLSGDGPILFRQRRVGLDQQEFEMLKFRSMRGEPSQDVTELPPDTAPGGTGTSERRTRVGRVLRKTSLDELPQLINVLRGEMSLVGPRPERPEFAKTFYDEISRYEERLRVKSGITGWAQVHGLRGPTSLSERVEWDNYYIENWSFWLDFKILLMTVSAVLHLQGD